jgi:hypothetical protein
MPRLLCFSKFEDNWNGPTWGVEIIGPGTIISSYSSMEGRGMDVLDAEAAALWHLNSPAHAMSAGDMQVSVRTATRPFHPSFMHNPIKLLVL